MLIFESRGERSARRSTIPMARCTASRSSHRPRGGGRSTFGRTAIRSWPRSTPSAPTVDASSSTTAAGWPGCRSQREPPTRSASRTATPSAGSTSSMTRVGTRSPPHWPTCWAGTTGCGEAEPPRGAVCPYLMWIHQAPKPPHAGGVPPSRAPRATAACAWRASLPGRGRDRLGHALQSSGARGRGSGARLRSV